MNAASQDLDHHLAALRERLLHPTDYEQAFHYFLEEFGGDQAFIALGVVEQALNLVQVLNRVATAALGEEVQLAEPKISLVPGHGFHHGSAAVEGRVAIFFYFETVNTGLLVIVPGVRGEAEMGRFRLPGSLTVDASRN